MKGKPFHNGMVACLRLRAEGIGARVHAEYPVDDGRRPRANDLFIEWWRYRIALEVEQSLARLGNDVNKAQDVGASILFLVFPTPRLAAAAKRKLRRLVQQGVVTMQVPVRVMTFGSALTSLSDPGLLQQLLPTKQTPSPDPTVPSPAQ